MKSGKTAVKPRYFNYLYIHGQGMTLLSKRTGDDIWRNLYEFPLIETGVRLRGRNCPVWLFFKSYLMVSKKLKLPGSTWRKKHVLSHRVIYPVFYEIRVDSFSESMGKYLKVSDNRVGEYAVSRLIQSYFEVRMVCCFKKKVHCLSIAVEKVYFCTNAKKVIEIYWMCS